MAFTLLPKSPVKKSKNMLSKETPRQLGFKSVLQLENATQLWHNSSEARSHYLSFIFSGVFFFFFLREPGLLSPKCLWNPNTTQRPIEKYFSTGTWYFTSLASWSSCQTAAGEPSITSGALRPGPCKMKCTHPLQLELSASSLSGQLCMHINAGWVGMPA